MVAAAWLSLLISNERGRSINSGGGGGAMKSEKKKKKQRLAAEGDNGDENDS